MRAAGLSARKVEYLVDLSIHFDAGTRAKTEALQRQSAQQLAFALKGADLGLWDWNIAGSSNTLPNSTTFSTMLIDKNHSPIRAGIAIISSCRNAASKRTA